MRPFTDREFDKLPTIFLADDSMPWDPSVLDGTPSSDEYWLSSHPEPKNHNPNFSMTGDYLRRTVLSSEIAWTFDAWGDNPMTPSDEEIIVFEHPPPKGRGIEIVVDEQVPDLVPPLQDDVSVSSDESDTTSVGTYRDLEDILDDIVDYTSDLKHHNTLVQLIQGLVDVKKEITKEMQTYSCVREPPDKSLVFAVTTRAQNRANQARETPEEPPTEAPPPEPPPAPTTSHMHTQAPVLDNGEIGLPDMEDDIYDQPIKVAGRPCTMKPSKRDWEALRPLFGWLDANTIRQMFDRTTQLARMPQSEQLK